MNQALLGKSLWRFGNSSETFTEAILVAKYDASKNVRGLYGPNYRFLTLWKGILLVKEFFVENVKRNIGTSYSIFFWLD